MTAKFDVSTLNWVKGEINASLEQARLALENFVATPDDKTQMGFCVMHLHQVYGTLQMVEIYGAALTAKAMENLAVAQQEGLIKDNDHANEVLMRAILQLPDYLEGLQTGLPDNALVMLPLINEMRRLCGEQALPESDFFQPDLNVMPQPSPVSGVNIQALAQKARPHYQSALLHLLRGEMVPQSLKTLRVLSDKLFAAAAEPQVRQWFWVFAGFTDSLVGDQVVRTASKRLLSNGEHVIRLIAEDAESAVTTEYLLPLLPSLLFQVAEAEETTGRIGELKTAFGLHQLSAGGSAPGGFNTELKKTLARGVLEELFAIQEALDIFMRGKDRQAVLLMSLIEPLSRISNTLMMMEQAALQQTLERQAATIRQLQDSDAVVGDDVLMDIASAVVTIQSALADWGSLQPLEQADDLGGQVTEDELSPEARAEHQRVIRQVMKEARNNLLAVKAAVDTYLAAPDDVAPLAPVAGLLHEAIGSLTLLSYTRAANVLRACSLYISQELARGDGLTESAMLDALADALTSIEYYMDAFVESRVHPVMVLEVAERACAKFGYPVDALPEPAGLVEAAPETVEEYREELSGSTPAPVEPPVELVEPPVELVEPPVELVEHTPSSVEPVPEPIAATVATAQKAASSELDPEIAEIFIEEATEEIARINELLPRWQANHNDSDTLHDLRRSFHTLKGSGRLVGALRIGEFAWAFEDMLNRVIDKTIVVDNAMLDLLDQAAEALSELTAEFNIGAVVTTDVEWLRQAAHAMSTPGGLEALLHTPTSPSSDDESTAIEVPAAAGMDLALLEIYSTETVGHLEAIEQFIAGCPAEQGCQVSEALIRALHTLQGSSRMAGVIRLADVVRPLEKYAKTLHTAQTLVSPRGLEILTQCIALARETLAFLQGEQKTEPVYESLSQDIEALLQAAEQLTEGLEDAPEGGLAQVEEGPDTAAAAEDDDESSLTEELLHLAAEPASDDLIDGIELPEDDFADLSIEEEITLAPVPMAEEEITLVDSEPELEQTSEEEISLLSEGEETLTEDPPPLEDILSSIGIEELPGAAVDEPTVNDEISPPISQAPVFASARKTSEYDEELLGIFLEEAAEIIDAGEESLQAWREQPDNQATVRALQRQLHTLKGGARMAGIVPIGDLSHTLESIFDEVVIGNLTRSSEMFDLLQLAHDRLVTMLDQVRQHVPVTSADDLIAQIRDLHAATPTAETTTPATSSPEPSLQDSSQADADMQPASAQLELADEALEAVSEPDEHFVEHRHAPRQRQEMVRVAADLLDNLVNQAGEVSIYRSRVEQQVGSANYSLRDLSDILKRMHEQLRQFAIEAEAQMQSRYEEVGGQQHEDFDPLEFDRFTSMQQLSRSATESLNDMVEVQGTLQGLMRDTETLLLQQSRVSTELQEGLMRTRMMPLVIHAPRLRRIVRQVSAELGKQAELSFHGAEVELDRHVIERMLAPIEHLLRNAVAHGIETPEQRTKAGKPVRGQITLAQVREGPEVVIRIIDDGAGINLESVRKKAIERGLMKADAALSDQEIVPFILESGFSTAENLSLVSGRGVGMDVVSNEIKQLGGVLEVDTQQGAGSAFTVRLPVTLSISRALLVQSGEQVLAVPMTTIQGVERLDHDQLKQLLAEEHPLYNWLGQDYELFTLTGTLGLTVAAEPLEQASKQPLLFVHSGDHRVAWVADKVLGSREIVVKSLGPQLSKLRGLSGATILGDGSVALILDLPLLTRLGLAQRSVPMVKELEQSRQPLVMVVDDSITVRKVTTRLLERNNMRAVTAKDGVDAIAQLDEVMPDVMLLDIEMPRMDGYELATHIRNTATLKHIPIIMITSRSGEKHRQRALEIGVEVYMSKPYQETEMLKNIHELLALQQEARAVEYE